MIILGYSHVIYIHREILLHFQSCSLQKLLCSTNQFGILGFHNQLLEMLVILDSIQTLGLS